MEVMSPAVESIRPARNGTPRVAYFSMEIEVESRMRTYSGGLGVLAGDTLRAAADLGTPLVAVTLAHRKGYFEQRLDARGNQEEVAEEWAPEESLEELEPTVSLTLEGRLVHVRGWRHLVRGRGGSVPVIFLDTRLPDNHPDDQSLTDHLYGGDQRYRLRQEAILGIAGLRLLRALGYWSVRTFHMNEGHSALLGLALLEERRGGKATGDAPSVDRDAVRRHCVFTTHTPVPAGHDQFALELVREVLGDERANALLGLECILEGTLNMTYLALCFSHFVNGVAMRHGEVTRGMFPRHPISSITNGVHVPTWTSPPLRELFDRFIPGWRDESMNLRYAMGIPVAEIQQAHAHAKEALLADVRDRTGVELRPDVLTIGFARRAAVYKRGALLFRDPERLRRLAAEVGPLQLIYAGKAHPHDGAGKDVIREVFGAAAQLADVLPVVYLANYDTAIARLVCAGVDLWLNTPQKPQEASGTSGMKAALNGVPSLSVLDGWWVEGCVEGVTGWAIGDTAELEDDSGIEVDALYRKLEQKIVPLFYGRPSVFGEVMRSAIALNGSFFSAERMMLQYIHQAYGV